MIPALAKQLAESISGSLVQRWVTFWVYTNVTPPKMVFSAKLRLRFQLQSCQKYIYLPWNCWFAGCTSTWVKPPGGEEGLKHNLWSDNFLHNLSQRARYSDHSMAFWGDKKESCPCVTCLKIMFCAAPASKLMVIYSESEKFFTHISNAYVLICKSTLSELSKPSVVGRELEPLNTLLNTP